MQSQYGARSRFLIWPYCAASHEFKTISANIVASPIKHAMVGFTRAATSRNLVPVNDTAANTVETSDEALMLSYAGGHAEAFDQLYLRHRTRLYRFLVRQLRDGTLADDLFQDIWQRVINARQQWKPDATFTTWLYRIAHNRIADHWRAQQHRPPAPHDADERSQRVVDPHTPENIASDFEQRRRLQLVLEELPDEQRAVVLLRLQQELSLEEIGEVTGVGRETVKSRLRYAMEKLRVRLSE